ncbi:MAG: hypothetical protein JXA69_02455 [Phycisphaerae bacterium]|nr:hypothetical protein [Phycisphaerae bacterium]
MSGSPRIRAGFTLVEVLIVALVLIALAMVVVPQFSSAATDVRYGKLTARLSAARNALELYRLEHGRTYPAVETFVEQMTVATEADGTVVPFEGAFGPYLDSIPVNPYTGTNTVSDGAAGTSAWYFNPATGEFRANDCEAHRAF